MKDVRHGVLSDEATRAERLCYQKECLVKEGRENESKKALDIQIGSYRNYLY